MSGFLFAFVATLLIGQGGRDQLLVAHMAGRTGGAILLAGWGAAIVSALVMAFAGATIADILPDSGKTMLVAFALVAAAVELAWPSRHTPPAEPTRSIAAAFLVLIARQFGDASRFVIFALAAALATPSFTALGGAIGGGAALTIGWLMGTSLEASLPLRGMRIAMAVITFIIGVVVGLTARGLIN